jgi:hypothetical protein
MIMYDFLEGYYERNGEPDEIGGLLGQLMLLKGDNMPADPAAFSDWLESTSRVLNDISSGGYKKVNF